MKTRLRMDQIDPKSYQALFGLENYLSQTHIDPKLKELIKIRASQLNGCAYCIDMHTRDARKQGESEQRIYALNAWRETPFFTSEERAVLALTEAITFIADTHVPDEVFEPLKEFYTDQQISALIMAIVTINAWNRVAITTRLIPKPTARSF